MHSSHTSVASPPFPSASIASSPLPSTSISTSSPTTLSCTSLPSCRRG